MTTQTTVLITGATAGLGAETAAPPGRARLDRLARCPDTAAGEAVAKEIPSTTPMPTCASCSST